MLERDTGGSKILALFLLRFRWWSELDSSFSYLYEHLSITLEPLRIGGCSIATSWICLRLCICEVADRLRKSLEKERPITRQCEHPISCVYPIFSEHGFCSEIRCSWETFEKVVESGARGGHDILGLVFYDMYESFDCNKTICPEKWEPEGHDPKQAISEKYLDSCRDE